MVSFTVWLHHRAYGQEKKSVLKSFVFFFNSCIMSSRFIPVLRCSWTERSLSRDLKREWPSLRGCCKQRRTTHSLTLGFPTPGPKADAVPHLGSSLLLITVPVMDAERMVFLSHDSAMKVLFEGREHSWGWGSSRRSGGGVLGPHQRGQ